MLFGLAVLGGYIYYGYQVFSGPSTIAGYLADGTLDTNGDMDATVDAQKNGNEGLTRALFLASKPEDLNVSKEDFEVTLKDGHINDLLENNVAYVRQGEPELFDLERVRLACLFKQESLLILDEVVVFGKSFLIRHEFE